MAGDPNHKFMKGSSIWMDGWINRMDGWMPPPPSITSSLRELVVSREQYTCPVNYSSVSTILSDIMMVIE